MTQSYGNIAVKSKPGVVGNVGGSISDIEEKTTGRHLILYVDVT